MVSDSGELTMHRLGRASARHPFRVLGLWLVAAIAVLKSGLATLPVVMRMNAAEEMSGLLTGALLLLALAGSVLPKLLSQLRPRRAPAPHGRRRCARLEPAAQARYDAALVDQPARVDSTRIELARGKFLLIDQSTNGTFVNGQRIQRVRLAPGDTLLSAIARAQSPTNVARLDEIIVFRMVYGRRMAARFDLGKIRAGRAPDPQVLAGDVVVVGYSALRGVYRDVLQAAPLLNVFTQF